MSSRRIGRLASERSGLKEEIDKLREDRRIETIALSKIRDEITEATDITLKSIRTQISDAKKELSEMMNTSSGIVTEILNLTGDKEDLLDSLVELNIKKPRIEAECQELNIEVEELKKYKEKLIKSITTLENEKSSNSEEVSKLKREAGKISEENEKRRHELEEKEDVLDSREKNLACREKSLQKNEDRQVFRSQQLKNLSKDLNDYAKTIRRSKSK